MAKYWAHLILNQSFVTNRRFKWINWINHYPWDFATFNDRWVEMQPPVFAYVSIYIAVAL